MEFVYEPELLAFMEKKGKRHIAVEVVSSEHSDIEITELYIHLMGEKQAEYYKAKKGYRGIETAEGEVLLPRYRLTYDDRIVLGLKKVLCFRSLTQTGIHL